MLHPAVLVAMCTVLGTLAGAHIDIPLRLGLSAALLCAAAACWQRGFARALLIGAAACVFSMAHGAPTPDALAGCDGRLLAVHGVVDAPTAWSSDAVRVFVAVDRCNEGGTWVPLSPPPRLLMRLPRPNARSQNMPNKCLLPRWGDEVVIVGHLQPPPRPKSPQAFDYAAWLGARHVHHLLAPRRLTLLPGRLLPRPLDLAARGRAALEASLDTIASYPTSAVLRGVVLAEGGMLPAEVGDDFRDSGTYHVLVTAGVHVQMVLACWLLLAACLRLSGPLGNLLGVPLVLAYAAVAGGSASILRAASMAAIGLGADALGRERDSLAALAVVISVMLWCEPGLLGETGFRMSVSCVLGIRYLTPLCAVLLKWLPSAVRGAAAVTLATQLAVAPLCLQAFGSLPLAGVAANLLVVPLCEVLLALGLVGGVLGALLPGCGAWLTVLLGRPASAMAAAVMTAVRLFAGAPALAAPAALSPGMVTLYYLVLTAAMRLYGPGQKRPGMI